MRSRLEEGGHEPGPVARVCSARGASQRGRVRPRAATGSTSAAQGPLSVGARRHDPRVTTVTPRKRGHMGQPSGVARAAELEAARVQRVAAAKAAGDRYRAASTTASTAGSSVSGGAIKQKRMCSRCAVRRARGEMTFCRTCALVAGYRACARCSQLVAASSLREERCTQCVGKLMCADCGESAPAKRSQFCHGCSLSRGYKDCSSCGKLFLPGPKDTRRRRCPACVTKFRGSVRRGRGNSVHTVSGGLPG